MNSCDLENIIRIKKKKKSDYLFCTLKTQKKGVIPFKKEYLAGMQFIFKIYFLLHLSVVYLHIDHSLPQRKTAKIVWLQNDSICHLIIIFDNFKQHSSLWSKYNTHTDA